MSPQIPEEPVCATNFRIHSRVLPSRLTITAGVQQPGTRKQQREAKTLYNDCLLVTDYWWLKPTIHQIKDKTLNPFQMD